MQGLLLPGCAVVFSILLCIIFFSKERIDNLETKIYAIILISILLDSIFACSLQVIAYFEVFNPITNFLINLINRLDFISLILYSTCLFLYAFVITNSKLDNFINIRNTFLIVDFFISIILFFLNIEVITDGVNYSINGSAAFFTFGLCGFYIIASIFLVLKNIKNADKRYIPIIMIVFVIIILLGLFLINPYLVIISVTLTLINYVMYFTIENPDVKMLNQMELARDQAERANRAKSDFLSSMSHEIRTPLNAIVGLSEDNLRFKDQVPKQVIENSNDIMNASQTLLEIVGNILDINKIEANKMELVNTPYHFVEEVTNMCKVTQTRIGEKNVIFNLSIADDIPYELIGDKGKVKEIINNLLTNSIKYTDKGVIDLNIKCINNVSKNISNIIVTCSDTGKGIKADNINKLFTKFERLDAEKNTTTEGTGLGLAITKALVEMMGGKINVQSTFGQGSMFVVSIPQKISKMMNPISDTQKLKLEELHKADLENAHYGYKKILIVDDNQLNIKVAKRALADFHFGIDECYDGKSCLEKVINGDEYDLILMDIMMPNMSGETAFSKLKEIPNFSIPVIALTADALAGAREKYLEEGFVDYIAKPFNKEQIQEKLDMVFKRVDDDVPKYDPHRWDNVEGVVIGANDSEKDIF